MNEPRTLSDRERSVIPGKIRISQSPKRSVRGAWWPWTECPACGGPVEEIGGRCLDRKDCNWPGSDKALPARRFTNTDIAEMRHRAKRMKSRKTAKKSRARNRRG